MPWGRSIIKQAQVFLAALVAALSMSEEVAEPLLLQMKGVATELSDSD